MAAEKSSADYASDDVKEKPAKSEEKPAAVSSATSGLRQRKQTATESGEPKSTRPAPELAQAVRQGTEGVPVQIVAILCLASFLLAYFFF